METATTLNDGGPASRMFEILRIAVEREASDVHLVPGFPATIRVHGKLLCVDEKLLEAAELREMVTSVVSEPVANLIAAEKNCDFSTSFTHEGVLCRFRGNTFWAQEEQCACFRHVPNEIPSWEWMSFPQALAERLVAYRNGLVVITGVTGSGKSTTLAAMVNLLNERGGSRIVTVEEPIEYVHRRTSTSMITQREVGRDVDSFYDGLKYGLRQDPDVLLIGEIRDSDTARMALSAAETGHLILTTMHTRDAKGAVTRMVDLFPHDAQDDVRSQLALSLRAVVSQHLVPAASEGDKRVLTIEVMHVNNPVRIAIKQGKIDSIESAIQTGKRDGMMTLDDDLQRHVLAGRVTLETARRFAKDPEHITGPTARR